MIIANYHQIRHKLKTGDIIGVQTGNRATRLFQWLTCPEKYYADVTHIGVLVWRGTRLHVAEMDGRYNVERPLSQYVGAYDRIMFFRPNVDQDKALTAIDDAMQDVVHYDVSDFFSVGLRVLFGVMADKNKREILCTQFACQILRECGVEIPDYPLAPAEVCAYLKPALYEVRR